MAPSRSALCFDLRGSGFAAQRETWLEYWKPVRVMSPRAAAAPGSRPPSHVSTARPSPQSRRLNQPVRVMSAPRPGSGIRRVRLGAGTRAYGIASPWWVIRRHLPAQASAVSGCAESPAPPAASAAAMAAAAGGAGGAMGDGWAAGAGLDWAG